MSLEGFSPNLAADIVENDPEVQRLRESHRELVSALQDMLTGLKMNNIQLLGMKKADVALRQAKELELQS